MLTNSAARRGLKSESCSAVYCRVTPILSKLGREKSKWKLSIKAVFSNFSCLFLNLNIFSNLNSDCFGLKDLINLQEQAFCYQKLFWPFTVWTNCFSDLIKEIRYVRYHTHKWHHYFWLLFLPVWTNPLIYHKNSEKIICF